MNSLPNLKVSVKVDYNKIQPEFRDLTPKIIARIAVESPESILQHLSKEGKFNMANKDNLESPLWISDIKKHQAMGKLGLRYVINKYFKVAEIKISKIYPHLFRHSRLTHLASEGFTEMELRIIAGWSSDSQMPKTYIHLSSRDIDKKMLEHAGLLKEEDKDNGKLNTKICPICNAVNSPVAKFCSNNACNHILDYRFAIDIDKKREESDDVVTKILEKITEKNKELVLEAINELKLKEKIENL